MIDLAEETISRILKEMMLHAEDCDDCARILREEFGIEVEGE